MSLENVLGVGLQKGRFEILYVSGLRMFCSDNQTRILMIKKNVHLGML